MKPLALVLAAVFFIVAILYWTGTLQIGASSPGPHVKHGIVFAILGALSLIWYRFQSGASTSLR